MNNGYYNSFLVCDHEKVVNIFRNGLPVLTVDKSTGKITRPESSKDEDVQVAVKSITALILTLEMARIQKDGLDRL